MITKESSIRQIVLEIALGADPSAGTPRNGSRPKGKDDQHRGEERSEEKTLVSPSLHSSIQLSSDAPNVRDPQYCPASTQELSKAMYAVGELIDSSDVENFWKIVMSSYKKFIGEDDE